MKIDAMIFVLIGGSFSCVRGKSFFDGGVEDETDIEYFIGNGGSFGV